MFFLVSVSNFFYLKIPKIQIFNNISNLILWTTSKKKWESIVLKCNSCSPHISNTVNFQNESPIHRLYKINTMKRGNKMKWKMFLGKRPLNHPHKMERISMCLSMDAWCVYCHQLFLCSCMYSFFCLFNAKMIQLLYGCNIQNTNSISFRLLTFNAHCPFLFCTFPVYIITAHTDTTVHPYTRAYTWTR